VVAITVAVIHEYSQSGLNKTVDVDGSIAAVTASLCQL